MPKPMVAAVLDARPKIELPFVAGQCGKTYELAPGETRAIIIKRVNFHCRFPLFVGYHLVISSSSAFVSNEGGLPDQYLSFIQQRACL
jgi:hypothetical protein